MKYSVELFTRPLKINRTRSNQYVWIPERHSGGEVFAAPLHVTLPVHKLVLLGLQRTKSTTNIQRVKL